MFRLLMIGVIGASFGFFAWKFKCFVLFPALEFENISLDNFLVFIVFSKEPRSRPGSSRRTSREEDEGVI